MHSLDFWKKKIQEKRKKTPYSQFIKEIVSWKPYGFYKNNGLISRYPESQRVKNIISPKAFLEVRDSLPYQEYDETQTFFENFKQLFEKVPLSSLVHFNQNENIDYADCVFSAKNIYLSTVIGVNAENVYYSAFCYIDIKNVFNSLLVSRNSENVYQSVFIGQGFNIFYSKFIQNCSNIWFSTNLIGCHECIFCDGIENAKYCIANKSYEKDDYLMQKNKILSNAQNFDMYFSKLPSKAINYNSKNISGNAIYFSENIENGFYSAYVKNGRNLVFANGDKGCEEFYDCFDVGVNSDNFYGVCSAGETGTNHIYCSSEVGTSSNIFYSYHIEKSSHCIGCIGLRNKHFCILNKQYRKEEWYEIAEKIFTHMEKEPHYNTVLAKNGENVLGSFFPPSLNPFYFNDTMALMIDNSFNKEDIVSEGYLWRDEKLSVDIPKDVEVVKEEKIGDFEFFTDERKNSINKDILQKVIQDREGNSYKIVAGELEFLNKNNLPLPRKHWFTRIEDNIKSL